MAAKTYTLNEIKLLVLTQINGIKGLKTAFSSGDSDEAYDEAVRECGFEHPETTDADKGAKYQLLIQRMRRWYLSRLLEQYILQFKSGDNETQQIVEKLEIRIKKMDEEFAAAKTEETTASLFVNSSLFFGSDIVTATGFINNRVGESIEVRT